MVVADVGAISETGFDGFPKDFDNKITENTELSSSGSSYDADASIL